MVTHAHKRIEHQTNLKRSRKIWFEDSLIFLCVDYTLYIFTNYIIVIKVHVADI